MENLENITENERRLLGLKEDKYFREKIVEIKNQEMSKEERINKIKDILAQKGIDYTQEDAELFESIINGVREGKIRVSNAYLKNISAGAGTEQNIGGKLTGEAELTYWDLPKDIRAKIDAQDASYVKKLQRKQKIIAGVTLASIFLAGGVAGGLIGYKVGKKKK